MRMLFASAFKAVQFGTIQLSLRATNEDSSPIALDMIFVDSTYKGQLEIQQAYIQLRQHDNKRYHPKPIPNKGSSPEVYQIDGEDAFIRPRDVLAGRPREYSALH